MSVGGLAVEYLFRLVRVPDPTRPRMIVPTGFEWDYTTFLNIAALVGFAAVYWLYRRRGTGDSRFAKDPVCGMQVEIAHAPAHRSGADGAVYFCSDHCAERYTRDRRAGHEPVRPRPPDRRAADRARQEPAAQRRRRRAADRVAVADGRPGAHPADLCPRRRRGAVRRRPRPRPRGERGLGVVRAAAAAHRRAGQDPQARAGRLQPAGRRLPGAAARPLPAPARRAHPLRPSRRRAILSRRRAILPCARSQQLAHPRRGRSRGGQQSAWRAARARSRTIRCRRSRPAPRPDFVAATAQVRPGRQRGEVRGPEGPRRHARRVPRHRDAARVLRRDLELRHQPGLRPSCVRRRGDRVHPSEQVRPGPAHSRDRVRRALLDQSFLGHRQVPRDGGRSQQRGRPVQRTGHLSPDRRDRRPPPRRPQDSRITRATAIERLLRHHLPPDERRRRLPLVRDAARIDQGLAVPRAARRTSSRSAG